MEQRKTAGYYLSKALSYLLHPFLMPFYMLFLLFSIDILPVYTTTALQRYIVGVVVVCTACIPAIAVILMRIFGLIDDYSLSTRGDRTLPLVVVTICYAMAAWVFGTSTMLILMRNLMLASTACTLQGFVVNLRWQISLHMISMGAATGITYYLLTGSDPGYYWILAMVILLGGALGSARLYLQKHSPAQIGAGYACGLVTTILVLSIL